MYGVDLYRIKCKRTARWARVRIELLLTENNALTRSLFKSRETEEEDDE